MKAIFRAYLAGAIVVVAGTAAVANSPSAFSSDLGYRGSHDTGLSTPAQSVVVLKQKVPIPGLSAGAHFSYDIGYVDSGAGRYLLSDRTNSSVDVIDTTTNTLVKQVKGFSGDRKSSSSLSGPNGIVGIPATSLAYVGDVGSVKIVDFVRGTVTKTIRIAGSHFRSDEGCYDRDDRIVMISNGDERTPLTTWISTTSQRIVASLKFVGAEGLEQCAYDPDSKNFYINNTGTRAHPLGEVDVIPATSVVERKPAISTVYATPGCPVSGMALGPNDKLLIGCAAEKGLPLTTLIVSASTGKVLKTITQVGGEDQVAYDASNKRFYTASREMTTTGVGESGSQMPVLGVIDGATLRWIENVPTGPNAHSVAVDSITHNVFVPVSPTASAPGGVNVYGDRTRN